MDLVPVDKFVTLVLLTQSRDTSSIGTPAEWSSCGRGDVRFQDAQLVPGNVRMCQSLTL